MAAIRTLRTTVGGYELFNVDSAFLANFFKTNVDLSAQIDGVATTFTVPGGDHFVDSTLRVSLKGVLQTGYLASVSGGTGQFTFSSPPLLTDGPLLVDYLKSN